MAAKKYYFGVGGGSRRFLSVVENDGMRNLFGHITWHEPFRVVSC